MQRVRRFIFGGRGKGWVVGIGLASCEGREETL